MSVRGQALVERIILPELLLDEIQEQSGVLQRSLKRIESYIGRSEYLLLGVIQELVPGSVQKQSAGSQEHEQDRKKGPPDRFGMFTLWHWGMRWGGEVTIVYLL